MDLSPNGTQLLFSSMPYLCCQHGHVKVKQLDAIAMNQANIFRLDVVVGHLDISVQELECTGEKCRADIQSQIESK